MVSRGDHDGCLATGVARVEARAGAENFLDHLEVPTLAALEQQLVQLLLRAKCRRSCFGTAPSAARAFVGFFPAAHNPQPGKHGAVM